MVVYKKFYNKENTEKRFAKVSNKKPDPGPMLSG